MGIGVCCKCNWKEKESTMEADASRPKQLTDDSPEESKQKDANIAFHEELPKKENTFTDTKFSTQRECVKRSDSLSYRSASKCAIVENYKVVPIPTEIEDKYSVEKWISAEQLSSEIIHEGHLYKYTSTPNKINLVLRYCQLNINSLKYFRNKLQGTEWLARPIAEYPLSEFEEISRIQIEDKKVKINIPGFEIVMKGIFLCRQNEN